MALARWRHPSRSENSVVDQVLFLLAISHHRISSYQMLARLIHRLSGRVPSENDRDLKFNSEARRGASDVAGMHST